MFAKFALLSILLQITINFSNGVPQNLPFLDFDAFHSKQHPLNPLSIFTDAAHIVVGSLHSHVENVKKLKIPVVSEALGTAIETVDGVTGNVDNDAEGDKADTEDKEEIDDKPKGLFSFKRSPRPSLFDRLSKIPRLPRLHSLRLIRSVSDGSKVDSSELNCECSASDLNKFHEVIAESVVNPKPAKKEHAIRKELDELMDGMTRRKRSARGKRSKADDLRDIVGLGNSQCCSANAKSSCGSGCTQTENCENGKSCCSGCDLKN